jgi:hypothetical protein
VLAYGMTMATPGVATGADGAEQIGILITLIFWLPRTPRSTRRTERAR